MHDTLPLSNLAFFRHDAKEQLTECVALLWILENRVAPQGRRQREFVRSHGEVLRGAGCIAA